MSAFQFLRTVDVICYIYLVKLVCATRNPATLAERHKGEKEVKQEVGWLWLSNLFSNLSQCF